MDTRKSWLEALLKIVSPVMDALEAGELKARLPLDFHADRASFAPLEAFGRSLLGLAPWLEAETEGEEQALQAAWRKKVLRCLDRACCPASPDFMNFSTGGQPLVDAAFLAHGLVRARTHLADAMEEETRRHVADALRRSRSIQAVNSNWLFFSAMVEAGLHVLGEDCDMMRVLWPMRVFQAWYQGDGVYGDGPVFHWDYYNSFVIQPMYVDLCDLFGQRNAEIAAMRDTVVERASRYASILERQIGPEGSYPVIGRSICYRFGAFQMLAQAALQHRLEAHLTPSSVRCALTAVMNRVMSAPDLFDEKGFLRPGVYGYQPELAEGYINIGSLYLCTALFLPLGLPATDPFWAAPEEDWSGRKVWRGETIRIDHAIE